MRRVLITLASVLLAGGCSSPAPTVSALPSASPSPPVAPSPAPPPTVTLAFAGDVHFEGRIRPLIADPANAFGPIVETLRTADLTILNLETPITQRGTPQPKTYTFRAPPSALEAITAAGIDAVSLGNNHMLDYGEIGLRDTLDAVHAAHLGLFGAGLSAHDAYRPWITTVQGVRIAVIALSQVGELATEWAATDTRPGVAIARSEQQISRVVDAVRLARSLADFVIVFPHWGQERNPCPVALQRSTAQALADAGADLIVGAHPHILQGQGWLGSTYVAYSMGNFLWYSNTSDPDTGVLQVTLTGSSITSVSFVPARIHPTRGQPLPVSGSEATRIQEKLSDLRDCTGLADARSV